MLPKKNRADKKAVERIFKGGKVFNSINLSFRYFLMGENENLFAHNLKSSYSLKKSFLPRISIIVPKTVSKLAVGRNLLRRRGYNALKKYIDQFPPGLVGAFIFKKSINSVLEIENEIKSILNKIN